MKYCKVRTFVSFGFCSACSLQKITQAVQPLQLLPTKAAKWEGHTDLDSLPNSATSSENHCPLIPLHSAWKNGFFFFFVGNFEESFKRRLQKHPSAIQTLVMKVFCFLRFLAFFKIFTGGEISLFVFFFFFQIQIFLKHLTIHVLKAYSCAVGSEIYSCFRHWQVLYDLVGQRIDTKEQQTLQLKKKKKTILSLLILKST